MVWAGFLGTVGEQRGKSWPLEHQNTRKGWEGLKRLQESGREVIYTSEHGGEGEHLIHTVKLAGGQQGFGQLRGQGDL